jgi:glucose/arabinose dehydrogenase
MPASVSVLLALVLSALGAPLAPAPAAHAPAGQTAKVARATVPALRVTKVVTGLDNPWDVKVLPSGSLLITERDRGRLSTFSGGQRRTVDFPSNKIWVSGETGLMSLAIDPLFPDNHRFYTCSGWRKPGGGHDVRVQAWQLSADETQASHRQVLVHGFPTSSGRHGGCRLLITNNGSLLIGTGDAAEGRNPQNLDSLGGKTLRIDRMTGKPWPTNKWADASSRRKFVQTYGHRNVQGLAQRADGSLWSVEHGPDRDDEINLLKNGGNYGWNPVPGYNEDVPMTDHSLPGKQIDARWSSGYPTLATSGATFLPSSGWGKLNGTLAVAALKANRVMFVKFDASGHFKWSRSPKKLRQLGRLRSLTLAPDGRSLLLTTDNDNNSDWVLRVRPRG